MLWSNHLAAVRPGRSWPLTWISTVCIALGAQFVSAADLPNSPELWKEYGLVRQDTSQKTKQTVTTYRMRDLTGALAAWQWLRPEKSHPCALVPFCAQEGTRTVISDANYVVTFEGATPTKASVDAILATLSDRHESSLPAILTFVPTGGRVPNSGRYILGPVSLQAFAPELASTNPGFEQGAEAQVAEYRLPNSTPAHLALFYYATPEMARLHSIAFKSALGFSHVKRSGVLVATAYSGSSDQAAETLLSRIQYEAKITWNETPPPSPIKPLYRLLKDILYISALLSLLSLSAGLVYAGMRIYRRRYGSLDSEEAMTTLHLTEE